MSGGAPLPGSRSAEALGRLSHAFLTLLQTRGKLLANDLETERAAQEARLMCLVVAAGAAGVSLLLFTLLGIVAFWDSHRLLAIGVAGAVYAAAALGAVARAARIGTEKPPLLADTLAELDKDRAALQDGSLARRVAQAAAEPSS
jgi:uncharacterized membrane protein YqjE